LDALGGEAIGFARLIRQGDHRDAGGPCSFYVTGRIADEDRASRLTARDGSAK
jgi:hypothetical protein